MSKHKKIRFIIHYVKPTAQLLFRIRFPKGGPTCRRQVVNPRHQTSQGQSVAGPRLKSPQSLSGTSAHPTTVTLVNFMVMNGWLTSFLFHVNRPSHSWDKAILDSDNETQMSRSWVWSKGKVIWSAQYSFSSHPFHFTSIRPTIPEIQLFRNLTLKHPRLRSWVRSKV